MLFGTFGIYRYRTESTETKIPRYRVFLGTEQYRLSLVPNYRITERPGLAAPPSSPTTPLRPPPPLPPPSLQRLPSHDLSNDSGCDDDWARQRRHNAEPAAPAPTRSLALRFAGCSWSWKLGGRQRKTAGRVRVPPPIRIIYIRVARSSSGPSPATKPRGGEASMEPVRPFPPVLCHVWHAFPSLVGFAND
ncbi:uncharacterized protein LOC110436493 [Sorghum bicolor]|uniref:uncharacterized protein LOC110436493 n=1 Tax=Sorghum bicolor TaxID=4558 RepID=UPI000B423AE6|nr:uncharacterized protein LOC110436493 [Sorghum bicolor]|eukprot:XP_021319290.1 uncharacterized protein LOC110436493 [Sorghum bicolor]